MQTNLSNQALSPPRAKEAEDILRTYVHCGFCNATCPTYHLLGNELDGPRGHIYLIKQMPKASPSATRRNSISIAASPAATAKRRVRRG